MQPAQTPRDALRAFTQAIDSSDEQQARAICTEKGWSTEGDTARRLFDQAVRKKLRLEDGEAPEQRDGRAALHASVFAEGYEGSVGKLWLLMRYFDEGWHIEGPTKSEAHKAGFLDGTLPAVARFEDLPESPEGRAWGSRMVEALRGDDMQAWQAATAATPEALNAIEELKILASDADVQIDLLGTAWLEPVQRIAVGFSFMTPNDAYGQRLWLIMDRQADGDLVIRSWTPSPTLTSMLE